MPSLKNSILIMEPKFKSKSICKSKLLILLSILLLLTGCKKSEQIKTIGNQIFETKIMEENTEVLTSEHQMVPPIIGKVIGSYKNICPGKHTGTDIKLDKGDTIRSVSKGLVIKSGKLKGYGKMIIIKHENSLETYYAHLSKIMVSKGDSVYAGEVIGLGGKTGIAKTPQLHFEIRHNGSPVNPENYFDFISGKVKNYF